MRGQADFTVETKGKCFFCLNLINSVKVEPGSSQMYSSNSFHSVQYLSSYLKINMIKVFPDTNSIPIDLQENVLKSKLKVELCDGCSTINEQFSKVFKELEKVKMEVTFWLQQILTKFNQVGNIDMTEEFHTIFGEETTDNEKLKIGEALRRDTLRKCFRRCRNECPKVRIHKMGGKEIDKEKSRLKSISRVTDNKTDPCLHSQTSLTEESFEDFQPINIKSENTDPDWSLDEDDGSNYSPDDSGSHVDELNFPVNGNIKHATISIKPTTALLINHDTKIPTTNSSSVTVNPSPVTSRDIDVPIKSISKRTKGNYKCRYCVKQFPAKHSRSRHEKSIHLGVKFTCHVCKKDYYDKCTLGKHLRTTTCRIGKPPEPKMYNHTSHCKLCGTGFVSKRGLHQHLQEAHLQLRNHECKICGNKFLRRWHLSNHRRKVHKLEN